MINVRLLGILFATVLGAGALAQQLPTVRPDPKHPNRATEDRLDAFWQRALQEVYKSPDELQAQHFRELRRGHVLPIIISGDPRQRTIALTFDDGPHVIYTLKLLEILRAEHVPATFFVIGKLAEVNPELIRAEAADGHLIANHTFSHVTLTKIPVPEIRTEYRACNDVLAKILGTPAKFCRPPGGDYDHHVIEASTAEGLTTVLWTDDPGDYLNPGDATIQRRVLSKLAPGAVVLLHDGIQQTLDVLPKIIHYAKAHGFRFVTIDKLPRG